MCADLKGRGADMGRRAAPVLALVPVLALTLALPPGVAAARPAIDSPAPRPGPLLLEVLAGLRAEGLKLIYSSDLVRPDMRVEGPPATGTPRQRLEQALAPHGLMAQDGPGGTILVVARPAPPPGAIRGEVVGRGGQAVRAARVRVGAGAEILTGRRGTFAATGLPPGSYVVHARAPGYLPRDAPAITVESGRETTLRIVLEPIEIARQTVRVTSAARDALSDGPEGWQVLAGEELTSTPTPTGDLLGLVAHLPGAVGSDRSAAVHVRGGAGDELLIVLDGLEVSQPFHLRDRGGLISIIDAAALGEARFLGGSFPAEYGGRMGGVLELASATPVEARTVIAPGTTQSRVQAAGALPGARGTWFVSGRRGDPRTALDLAGVDTSYEPLYYDLFARGTYRLGPRSTLGVHALLAWDHLEHAGQVGDADDPDDDLLVSSSYRDQYFWLRLESTWSAALRSRTVLSAARSEGLRRLLQDPDFQVHDERATDLFTLRHDWTLAASPAHFLKWGAAASHSWAEYDYAAAGARTDPVLEVPVVVQRESHVNPIGTSLAAYVADRVRLAPGWVVEAGLRLERQDYSGFEDRVLAPRFGLAFDAGPRDTLRAGWGYFYQPQRIQDLQVEDGVEAFFPAQRAEHRTAEWEHAFARGAALRVGLYDKTQDRLRPRYENLFDPFGLSPEAGADRVRIAPQSARSRGVELTLRAGAGPAVDWWAGYTLALAEDRIDGKDVPRAWDQRHTLDLGLRARPGGGFSLALAGSASSGRPTTALTAYAVTQPDGSQQVVPVLGPRNAARLPEFLRLDLRALQELPLARSRVRLALDVTNLLDASNACCVADVDFAPQADGSVEVERRLGAGLSRRVAFQASIEF